MIKRLSAPAYQTLKDDIRLMQRDMSAELDELQSEANPEAVTYLKGQLSALSQVLDAFTEAERAEERRIREARRATHLANVKKVLDYLRSVGYWRTMREIKLETGIDYADLKQVLSELLETGTVEQSRNDLRTKVFRYGQSDTLAPDVQSMVENMNNQDIQRLMQFLKSAIQDDSSFQEGTNGPA